MSLTVLDTARLGHLLEPPVRYPIGSDQPELPVSAHDLEAHLVRYGALAPEVVGSTRLLHAIDQAGLTGHGGAHFSVARKLQTHHRRVPAGVLVANGAESEPLSAKDMALLQLRPHLVLDGLTLVAQTVGAEETVVWLHGSAGRTEQAVLQAIAERTGRVLDGRAPAVRSGPASYLAGESSAVVRALSGGPALPTFQPTRGALTDDRQRPVLVHNVETLARIALLARGISTTTRLFTVAHRGLRTVVEAAPGASVLRAIRAGDFSAPVSAALVGGYGGRWFSQHDLADLTCAAAPGAGVLLPLTDNECGLRCAAAIAEYLSDAGARQCGPCRHGLPAVAEALDEVADAGRRRTSVDRLRRVLAQVAGRGACGHPDGAVAMVASALEVFAIDLGFHLDTGRCRHDV